MTDFSTLKLPLMTEDIKKLIPHRYPFLLIDRITEITESSIKGYKNITIGESFFQGHFPETPVMPGVLIIEALAQISCLHEMLKEEESHTKVGLFAGIDSARFRNPAYPGDKLELEATILWTRKGIGRCKAVASVDNKICFEGELTFALVDKNSIK